MDKNFEKAIDVLSQCYYNGKHQNVPAISTHGGQGAIEECESFVEKGFLKKEVCNAEYIGTNPSFVYYRYTMLEHGKNFFEEMLKKASRDYEQVPTLERRAFLAIKELTKEEREYCEKIAPVFKSDKKGCFTVNDLPYWTDALIGDLDRKGYLTFDMSLGILHYTDKFEKEFMK